MNSLSMKQIAIILDGELYGDDKSFSQLSINTRTINNGDLFVAIKGDNFDAHDYLEKAEEKGACAFVVEKRVLSKVVSNLTCLVVNDTRIALRQIAALWRAQFDIPVLAITGSCGKTTIKEMTSEILAQAYQSIMFTQGNLNNDIGVPLTLMRLTQDDEVAVVEIGANHMNEIEPLVNLAQPKVALISNVTYAHIEGFGTIENIAQAKAEIYTGLSDGGYAIVNADDQFSTYWQELCKKLDKSIQIITISLHNSADISAQYEATDYGSLLMLSTPIGQCQVKFHQYGEHNIYNALLSTAATIQMGCNLAQIKQGLENFTSVSGRLEQKKGRYQSLIFDDTYNANPGSVLAGVKTVKELSDQALIVLGDMAELGELSNTLHHQLGKDIAQLNIKNLFCLGDDSQEIVNAYQIVMNERNEKNDKNDKVQHFEQAESLIQAIEKHLKAQQCLLKDGQQSIVLVKGSRSMSMENIVDALIISHNEIHNEIKDKH